MVYIDILIDTPQFFNTGFKARHGTKTFAKVEWLASAYEPHKKHILLRSAAYCRGHAHLPSLVFPAPHAMSKRYHHARNLLSWISRYQTVDMVCSRL